MPPATSAVRGFISIKDGMDPIPYQSNLERQFLVVCACLPWVNDVTWEPLTLRFHENATLLDRSYTPDFLLEYQDGMGHTTQLLVETKLQRDWLRSKGYMAACYAAAETWAEQQPATEFFHASDVWFKKINFPNYQFIFDARKGAVSNEIRRQMVKVLLNQSKLTMQSAIQLLNAQGISDYNQAAATLMALVSDGYLGFDVSVPLTMETSINANPIANPFVTAIITDPP